MALSDSTLIGLLTHESVGVRSASLELLSGSFSNDGRWLPQIFAAWDRYGAQEAFPEFPLLTHFAIPNELVSECIDRAQRMSAGKPITDRGCGIRWTGSMSNRHLVVTHRRSFCRLFQIGTVAVDRRAQAR